MKSEKRRKSCNPVGGRGKIKAARENLPEGYRLCSDIAREHGFTNAAVTVWRHSPYNKVKYIRLNGVYAYKEDNNLRNRIASAKRKSFPKQKKESLAERSAYYSTKWMFSGSGKIYKS